MIRWLDLRVDGDPHPRRFDSAGAVREYLRRVERLDEEAVDRLLEHGEIGPPVARRGYTLRPLRPE
ncbi:MULTISPECIES: hypothetical protein [Deinococcus]|uniref:Uncharacterized protein n=1 Tax=Deinococcus rufus TaxID=2136097 RepID=A0ABV7ZBX0_9DEIO|nr:hypothetical protein [Deinococcus sp. AB2017081]WQE93993.1 hypothetical protein U2P90_11295 [Deinococcus sp. AB2017081]